MPAQILDGKAFADKWHDEAARAAALLKAETGIVPGLAVVLVGDNPASISYVTAKERACARDGFLSRHIHLPADVPEEELIRTVRDLNGDDAVHGILVQLPLPRHIREEAVIDAIAPEKDVDGFTPENIGRMVIGRDCFLPCTPHGIVQLLVDAGIETSGRHAVVVGRSNIVGRPLANLLMRKAPGGNATATICHTATRDPASYTRQADILVAAAGDRHRRRRQPRPGPVRETRLSPRRRRRLRLGRRKGGLHHPRARRRRPPHDCHAHAQHPARRATRRKPFSHLI